MKLKILDCTLRDGGYYTNWDFSKDLIDKYLAYVNKLPIDYIEVGYKSNQKSSYGGEYYYLPSSTIKHISKNTEKKIAVMINAKDNINPDFLLNLIPYVSLIRITTSPEEIQTNLRLAKKVKDLGFEVAMNIMYISKLEKWSDDQWKRYFDNFTLTDLEKDEVKQILTLSIKAGVES